MYKKNESKSDSRKSTNKIAKPSKNISEIKDNSDLRFKEREFHNSVSLTRQSEDTLNDYIGSVRTYKIHDGFLNKCRHSCVTVHINLIDTSNETGTIIAFDSTSILMQISESGKQALIIRNYITKISTDNPPYSFNGTFKRVFYDNGNMIYDCTGHNF